MTLKETILMVQTCDLKVDINCQGCVKKIKKIMQKIDGVYQTNVDRQQGKVTITGQMDMDTVFKKLKKGSMSAQFWEANSTDVSNLQEPQLGDSDNGDQLGDVCGKILPQGEARSNGATMVLPPQVTPTPEPDLSNIQQQIEQRLRMLNGKKLPPQPKGVPPGDMQSGKKICGGTVPANARNDNKNDVGKKLYQDAGGSQVKNGVIGQPPHNGALLGILNNNHGQAKKDNIGVGVGSQMMGGSMAPPKVGIMRPTNIMVSPTSFSSTGKIGGMPMNPYPNYDGYNMQPYGGSAIHGPGMHTSSLPRVEFYPSGAGSNGMEMNQMMQQVVRNPMPQQPYMMVQPQQEHEMMMSAHFPHSQNAHYETGCTGYQLMGYDNGHGHLEQNYPPPMYYPMPLPPQDDNIFSDENPNICSLM